MIGRLLTEVQEVQLSKKYPRHKPAIRQTNPRPNQSSSSTADIAPDRLPADTYYETTVTIPSHSADIGSEAVTDSASAPTVLEASGVRKSYGALEVLHGVD